MCWPNSSNFIPNFTFFLIFWDIFGILELWADMLAFPLNFKISKNLISIPSMSSNKSLVKKNSADILWDILLDISIWSDNVFITKNLEIQSVHHQTIWLTYSYIQFSFTIWLLLSSAYLGQPFPILVGSWEGNWLALTCGMSLDVVCVTSRQWTLKAHAFVCFFFPHTFAFCWLHASQHSELKSRLLKIDEP